MIRLTVLFLCLISTAAVHAHTRSYSYSQWEMDEQPYQLTVRLNQYELTRLDIHPELTPDYELAVVRFVHEYLQAEVKGRKCEFREENVENTADGWSILRASFSCDSAGQVTIRSHLFLDAVSSHMHFVTVSLPGGQNSEKLLTEADNEWVVPKVSEGVESQSGAALADYWYLGVEHILTGWDHLAFVFGLLLLAARLSALVWLITGFTLAHSLTLAMAVLGYVQPTGSAVEALIGLSILLVAIEVAWERMGRGWKTPALACTSLLLIAVLQPTGLPMMALLGVGLFTACYFGLLQQAGQPERWRLLLSFAFGLFHGFGFAGILAEIALPEDRLLSALFGFNLGVECGQLLVVALLWPLLRYLGMRLQFEALGTTALAGLGTFWFITRAFG